MFGLASLELEALLQHLKMKIEFSIMFGLAFQNCFYPPKTILYEATIPSF